jgi:hypothetical protein
LPFLAIQKLEKSKQNSEKSNSKTTQQHALAILALIGGMEAHVYSCDLSQNADRPLKREQHILSPRDKHRDVDQETPEGVMEHDHFQ